MIELYVSLIKKGLKTLDDVPEKWREKVKYALYGVPYTEFNF